MDIDARHLENLRLKETKKPYYKQLSNRIKTHHKSIGWAVLIFLLSSIPGNQLDKVPFISIPYFDKWVHLGLYLVFSGLIMYEWNKNLSRTKVFAAIMIGIIFGAIMELMQAFCFSGRSAESGDMVSNILGSVLAWPAMKYYVGLIKN